MTQRTMAKLLFSNMPPQQKNKIKKEYNTLYVLQNSDIKKDNSSHKQTSSHKVRMQNESWNAVKKK